MSRGTEQHEITGLGLQLTVCEVGFVRGFVLRQAPTVAAQYYSDLYFADQEINELDKLGVATTI